MLRPRVGRTSRVFQASVSGYLNEWTIQSLLWLSEAREGSCLTRSPEGLTCPPHACRNLLGCLPLGLDFNLGGHDLVYHEFLCDCG